MQLVVEYLVVLPKEDSFCDSVETFTRLLQVDSAISIKKGELVFEENFFSEFQIASGDVPAKEQRFFHLRLASQGESDAKDRAERFTALLKRIRTILTKTGGMIEVLWDDISFLYSREAYAEIHEIENLMRKLIANFMLVTVGKEWVAETSPSEVQAVISKSKRKDYVNVLHAIDFIHLADFLTKPYSKWSPQELYTKLSKATEANLKELQEYVPRSNWQRYFSGLVNCDDSYLQKRWSELYELRCKVAHNAAFTRLDLKRVVELVEDLRGKLSDALSKLPQVSVPQEEKELVAESAASSINALSGDFIFAWRELQDWVHQLGQRYALLMRSPSKDILHLLRTQGRITPDEYKRFHNLQIFRNQMVHEPRFAVSEAEMRARILEAEELTQIVRKLFLGDDVNDNFALSA